MGFEETEGHLFIPPLPVVKREIIERALTSLTEQNLINARHSKLPLFAWLAQHDMLFFFGGAFCRYVLEREAQPKGLTQVTQKTMKDFKRELKIRKKNFFS